jgi:hypothetical protein
MSNIALFFFSWWAALKMRFQRTIVVELRLDERTENLLKK